MSSSQPSSSLSLPQERKEPLKKIVLKVDLCNDKDKRKALAVISFFPGIHSIAVNMKDMELTVVGVVDPISVVAKLRKNFSHAEILSVGPVVKKRNEKEGGVGGGRSGDGSGGKKKSFMLRQSFESPRITSGADDAVIYGREDDKRTLIQLLLSVDCSELDISLVQITGAGGVGKSTLAYLVYSDSMICDYFDVKAWVHMPESIDASKLLKVIIESLTGISCYVTELNELKQIIAEELSGKRFLIVLDNVRSGIQCFWDSFGSKGSIIMATTRTEIVSDLMGSIIHYHLNNLSDEQCLSIFLEYAFDKQDPRIFPELIQIGKHIVAKCEGNPLAAKALGSLLHFNENSLYNNNIKFSKDMLESSLWESNECYPPLYLCYYYLPRHLKLCFSYCSLFPKGYIFEKDHLIRLWMSQGYDYLEFKIRETTEENGVNCFENLLRRSFFQCLHIYDAGERKYGIHDLFHDLARHVASDCFRTEDSKLSYIPESISHVSLVPCAV